MLGEGRIFHCVYGANRALYQSHSLASLQSAGMIKLDYRVLYFYLT